MTVSKPSFTYGNKIKLIIFVFFSRKASRSSRSLWSTDQIFLILHCNKLQCLNTLKIYFYFLYLYLFLYVASHLVILSNSFFFLEKCFRNKLYMLTLKRMILCPRKREAIILTAEKDQIKGLIDAKNNHFKNMLCNKRMYTGQVHFA